MKIYMRDNFCTIYKLTFHKIEHFLELNGQVIVQQPEDADLIIVGTCASFEADEERSLKMLAQIQEFQKKTFVFGCMVRVKPDKIKADRMYATFDAKSLANEIIPKPNISWESVELPSDFRSKQDYRVYNPDKKFVGISTGCTFECSYCPHKLGAGNGESRPKEDILKQINRLVKENVKTIVLTGIDTASYGRDCETTFPELLESILGIIDKDTHLHIAQFNPEGLRNDWQELVKCCQDTRIEDFQLPIQSCSARILKLMNRNYTIEKVKSFIDEVRYLNPLIMFRTDLMVGFPTETLEELETSIDFAVQNFNEVTIYGYEFKHNTPIETFKLKFYNSDEIKRRMKYATEKVKNTGLLVHSGGQVLSTLQQSDLVKEEIRRRFNEK